MEAGYVNVYTLEVTARKQAQEALRKRGIERLDPCFGFGLHHHDGPYRLYYRMEPGAEKTFGYSREQAVGQPVHELIIPLATALHRKGLQLYLATGNGAGVRETH